MVTARTSIDYIKPNLEIYGSYLDDYLNELRAGGKSESGVAFVKRCIRSFLARCPPKEPKEITAMNMADVSAVMEADNLRPLAITESLVHTGRFLCYITGHNPYNEIDPNSKEEWFEGHMGEFLFQDELDEYIEYLNGRGLSQNGSVRRKRIHITICCRILEKEMGITDIELIGEDCFFHLSGLMKDLSESVSKRILFNLDEFVRYYTLNNPLKDMKRRRFDRKKYEDTEEWMEFMDLLEEYKDDMVERGLRPRSIQGIVLSVKEGYQALIEEFGPVRVEDIDYHHIRYLRNNMTDLKDRTIKIYLGRLGKFLEFHFDFNPYRRADLVWSPQQVNRTWIFKDEWKILWDAADVTGRLVLALTGGMGIRRAEVAGIKLADIRGTKITIRGKGHGPNGKVVELDIPPTVMKCINDYKVVRNGIIGDSEDISEGSLFVMDTKRRGAPATIRFVESILQELSAKTGIYVTCHTLRRFFCTSMVDAGTDMDLVRRLMRHENITTTYECYVGVDSRKMTEATSTVESAIFA